MRVCAGLILAALPAFCQTEAPKFEVADVHSSPRANQILAQGPFYANTRYELRFNTMLDLIRIAYGVDAERVYGGPSWLEMDRFDVLAKTPPASTAESRRLMLQSLLADRFHLVVANESKPVPAYALTASKKTQLKESDGTAESGCNFTVQNQPTAPPQPGQPIALPTIVYTCRNVTMASLASRIADFAGAGQYLSRKPIVDRTELQGAYDFVLRYTPKIPAAIQTVGEAIPFTDAFEKQLGLKLEASTAPMPVFNVVKVDRAPTPNSPEAMKSFPPLPTEFEVVDLKPLDPKAPRANVQPTIRNGRVYLPGITLKTLIQVAWDLNGDEFLINAPKWMDEDRYDVLAKASAGVAIGDLAPQRNGISINLEALKPMIRSMVVERFQFKSHTEERPLNSYTLVAVKPKLKQADPAARTRWQEGVDTDAKPSKNANGALGRLVTCQNVSMAQLADLLPGIAPGYIRTKVVDATGLEGGWDFTFSFSPAGLINRPSAPKADGEGNTEASEPTAAISLFDAIAKQLGLKLETQKRPAEVLVIDHVERKPTDN